LIRSICLGVLAALAFCLPVRAADAPPDATLTLASTTSVDNSGLLAAILPQFTKATGITVRVLALGTGQALDTARRGDADIVLVHDPDAEQNFSMTVMASTASRSPGTISLLSAPMTIPRI
jgi:tungstate transport system substrate-binding protein